MSIDTGFTIEDRIKAVEEAIPVPCGDYRKLEAENADLKARVAELVSALERINGMDSMSYHSLESAKIVVRHALAAYRKGGGA